MSNTIVNPAAPAAVVIHDTTVSGYNDATAAATAAAAATPAAATPAVTAAATPVIQNGSVNLSTLGVPARVVVQPSPTPALAAAATVSQSSDLDTLKSLEQQRVNWEHNELAASNRRLYTILTQAYGYYWDMKTNGDKDLRQCKRDALDTFITERGYVFTPSSHDMTRVIKCVFGVDRRRVSAYSIALREALRQGVEVMDLVAFIEVNNGVEQIRLGTAKPLSATRRADTVRDHVLSCELARIKLDPVLLGADAEWADKQVILVATYLPTGELSINTVVKNDSAVTAALAAVYSNERAAVRQAERDAKEADAAVKKAARDAEIAENKRQRDLKGADKRAADAAEAQRLAGLKDSYNKHFESVAA